jgi:hypothetical protein
MPADLTIIMEDRPGTAADMGEALGKAGVNIDGFCGFPCDGEGIAHILVEDAVAARSALEEIGLEVRDERQVLVLDVEDRPGALGEIVRKIADVGVNIDLGYMATKTRLVFGTDNLEKAKAALEQ